MGTRPLRDIFPDLPRSGRDPAVRVVHRTVAVDRDGSWQAAVGSEVNVGQCDTLPAYEASSPRTRAELAFDIEIILRLYHSTI